MTREEQIRQASIEYTIKDRPMCIGGDAFSEVIDEMNRNYAFEEGAKWADKTMAERVMTLYEKGVEVGMKIGGQIKVDQACEWLDNNFPTIDNVGSWYKENFIKEFKKYLEE